MNNEEIKRDYEEMIVVEDVSLEQSSNEMKESMESKKGNMNKNNKNNGLYYIGFILFSILLFVIAILIIVIKHNDVDKIEIEDNSKDIVVPIDLKLEEKDNGRGFVVLRAIDFATDGESFPFLKSEKNKKQMQEALKGRIGLIEGSKELVAYAFDENKGIEYRLLSPNLKDSCSFYYEKEEVDEIYHKLFEEIDDELEESRELDRYDIGDYSISIPETMYLSNDKSFEVEYNFKPKDNSKYARIQVKIDHDDYIEVNEMLRNGERFLEEEVEYLNEYLMEELTSTGMNPRNLQGPHYIKIDGETSIHWEYDRWKPTPTHVDSYSFYASRKCVTITTSYRISEEEYWKKDLENAIKGIRKVK